MVIDTSVMLAILQDEPECGRFIKAIEGAASRLMSTATLVETSLVIDARYAAAGLLALERFNELAGMEFRPVDLEQAKLAREAWSRFGKGRHRASLNYGDCFSYALAKATGQPLLFKGDDFGHTDIHTERA